MNTMDWIFVGLIVILAIRCFVRGFVEEILSVASIVGGIFAALLLYRPAGAFLKTRLGVSLVPEVLGFLVVFLLTFLAVKLLERLLTEGLEASRLERADRIVGLFLGMIEGLLLVSVLLVIMSIVHIPGLQKALEGSAFAKLILPIIGPEVTKALTPAFNAIKKP
ncbi:MAG TPA: CvpA family protein [Rectinemataceae bacterium]|nr:CvpA family protein [Rectinemataceae bacterium]